MGSYSVEWKKSAIKELKRIDKTIIPAILESVLELRKTPLGSEIRKLTGSENIYRKRVGDYRIIFAIDKEKRSIEIVRVRHRKDVYR